MKRMSQALEVRRLGRPDPDADADARIVVAGDFNATPDEVPVFAIRGAVEDTGNGDLDARVLVPIDNAVPEPARYTLCHQGRGQMLDHMLATRNLLAHYRGSCIRHRPQVRRIRPRTGRRHLRVRPVGPGRAAHGRTGRMCGPSLRQYPALA
jgi:hypothetical protein